MVGRGGTYTDGPSTELTGVTDGKKGYFGGRNYDPEPVELHSPAVVHEIGTGR